MNFQTSKLTNLIRYLLFATAFAPLLYSNKFFFPYITQKLFFVRGVILIALAIALILFLFRIHKQRPHKLAFLKSALISVKDKIHTTPAIKPLFAFGALFVISQILSTIFSEFPYRAFWGTLERGGGLFNTLHFVVFFLLLVIFFTKKDFRQYFEFSVAVGFIVYLYAIFQALKFTQLPFAFAYDPRPGSFIGNGAFLAAYSFFVMIVAVITAWFSKEQKSGSQKFWFTFSIVTMVVTPIIIFLTRTRGALVGFGVSIIAVLVYSVFKKTQVNADQGNQHSPSQVFEKRKFRRVNQRSIAAAALIVLVVFGLTLFLTRDAAIWQKVPGIDRLVQTSGPGGGSTQVRLLGWKLAVNAFLEKPIFGWGPEHYLQIFQERYNSEFDAYGEVWLDRAHNGILDVAAMQGLVGLIGYIGFLVGLLWFFFRTGPNFNSRFFIGVILLGFVVQNLFLLEEFHTHAPFFALAAAVVAGVFSKNKERALEIESQELKISAIAEHSTPQERPTSLMSVPLIGISLLIFTATSFAIYKTVLVPTVQAYYTHKAEAPQSKEEFFNFFGEATKQYNFAQYSIRSYLFDFFYANQTTVFTDSKLVDVGNSFINSINEVLEREGAHDIRLHIRLSQAHYEMAKQIPPIEEPISHYRAGEEILRKALLISPLKQELIYGLGFALTGQGRYEEAVELMRKNIESNSQSSHISRLHYYYGLILAASGRGDRAIQAFDDARRADPQLTGFSENDIKGLFSIYESLGEYARIIDIVTESAKQRLQAKIGLEYYEIALPYYLHQEDGENMIVIAEFIAKKFPEKKSDMEAIIDLVRDGEWSILKSL